MNVLELENIQLGYWRRKTAVPVFVPFSAQANEGGLIALIGRNGKGKSTLLRCIVGLHKVLEGNILIRHKAVKHFSPRELAAIVSYVSTDNVKVGNLKVFDLVSLGRYPYLSWLGGLSADDKGVVERSLRQVGMLASAYKNINQLSDGERQRVIIARALAQDTPLIVLDEPTAFLDVPNRYEIILLLKTLAEQCKKTIILSTHDIALSLKMAHKVWLMGDDKFYADTPQSLQKQGIIEEIFGTIL
ncbi:ABC transporter ATP-binding protein [Bacteroidia bacterium]|nr:ABC transporter ATP-binding protein [Bacteroidia bacterium]